MEEKTKLSEIIKIEYLTKSDAEFSENGGMITMKLTKDGETKDVGRVFLHRCFPHETENGFISVLDREGNELGLIRDAGDFGEEVKALIERELGRRYRVFIIKKIKSVNERYGYSYWKAEDDSGEFEFTVRDTYRSITKIDDDRIYISDIDGNRYEIPSLSALDRKSFKRIELYL